MKNLRRTWSLLAFSIFFTFSACQKDEVIEPETELQLTDATYQLEDLDALAQTDVSAASETDEFRINDAAAHRTDRHPLAEILPKLNLTERQKKAVRGFVEQHAACTKEHRQAIHELHHELIRKANAVRQDYISAYRAGRISEAELEQKLQALRERLREEINNNEPKQRHMRMLHKCRVELLTKIASVLNEEQLQRWNRWKQSL